MSVEAMAMEEQPQRDSHWALWRRQVVGILRLELRKNIFSMRAALLYFLAAVPVGFLGLLALVVTFKGQETEIGPAMAFAGFFFFFLGLLFFGSLITFLQLFRGDVMDQSLHYYFLCPVRREVLVAAKYIAGVVSTTVVMSLSLIACYALTHYIFVGSGGGDPNILANLFRYLGVSFLAVLGYGAVFMLSGLYFKNPVLFPIALSLWELIHPFLPALLKKLSVIYYVLALMPFPMETGPFEILADPISPFAAILGLLALAAVAVWLSALRIRRMEISYTDD
jgi:ABC-type transport system involved in multi-copper enzyme maturation permease subunit